LIVDEEASELADAVLNKSEQLLGLGTCLILKHITKHCERQAAIDIAGSTASSRNGESKQSGASGSVVKSDAIAAALLDAVGKLKLKSMRKSIHVVVFLRLASV
jgi:hypothetical protein